MAKPNYGFDKRQREIKKSKEQEEKRLKKQQSRTPAAETPENAETPAKPPEAAK
ncbi:MAG: hypothetical protein ABI650_02990 [Dokdonella sp.]